MTEVSDEMVEHFFDGDDRHLPQDVKAMSLKLALDRGGQTTPVCSYDIDRAKEIITGEVNEIARLQRALTAALAVAPKPRVRKLEWQPYPGEMGENGARFVAYPSIGHQYIVTLLGKPGDRWLTSIGSSHDDLDGAKAAAQADYTARILAALEDGQ